MYIKRTLIAFAALSAAIGCYSQKQSAERLSGHEMTEVQYVEQRVTLPSDTLSVDSLVEVRQLELRKYIDTLRTIVVREDTIIVPGDSSLRKGHYVEIHAGAGIGNVGYGFWRKDLTHATATGYEQAGISGAVQIQYAYFFHKNVGIGVGAWLSNYTSHGYLHGDFVFPGQWDDDNLDGTGIPEQYTHHMDVRNWHERQTVHTVGVPVSLQIQAWGKQNKAGFFMSLGAAPTYIVKTNYHVLSGEVEHWGLYRENVKVHNVPGHGFFTIDNKGRMGKHSFKQFNAFAFLDLGLLVRMSPHTDFLLGVYGHYAILDMQDAALVEPGWNDAKHPTLNMPEYNGILTTTCLGDNGALRPWQAGVKIGVHWHSIDKPHPHTILRNDTALQMVTRYDSVWTTRIDTLQRQVVRSKEQVQRTLDKLNRIYFDFNSFELTDDTKAALDEIAKYLRQIPNKVILGGHASKEGSKKHNERLAHYRALTVKYYLVDQGIPATRMLVRDYGSTVSNALNLSDNLSLDRRVEIIVQDE